MAIDLLQFDGHHLGLLQRQAAEEVRRLVVWAEESPVVLFHNRGELMQVADHEQLHAAKCACTVGITTQHVIDGVQQIGSNHADFINDEQFKSFNEIDLVAGKTTASFFSPCRARNVQTKRQLKERMQRHAACVDRGYSCGCRYDHSFESFRLDLVKECRFPGSGLARKEDVPVGIPHVIECEIQFGVGGCIHEWTTLGLSFWSPRI